MAGDAPVAVRVRERSFVVTGSTAEDLRVVMALLGPTRAGRRFAAYTDWEVGWRIHPVERPLGFTAGAIAVEVGATVTVPSWRAPRSASAELSARFAAYLAALRAHEEGHVAIARSAGEAVRAALAALAPAPSVGELRGRAEEAVRAVLAAHRERERAYDVETDHGARSGAVFPA